MTATPTARQLALLAVAHRNGGKLPPYSFARSGAYPTCLGTENIQAALADAADTRDDAAAARVLTGGLNDGQLRMAGGFLGVDDRSRIAPGNLADQYVTRIRAGYLTHDGQRITLLTLRSCIAHGWLDDRWQLTDLGLAAGQATESPGFWPRDVMVIDEAQTQSVHMVASERCQTGRLFTVGDLTATLGQWDPRDGAPLGKMADSGWSAGCVGRGKTTVAEIMRTMQRMREEMAVRAAVASAVGRDVPQPVAERLAPAVTGQLADALHARVNAVAHRLAGIVGGDLGVRLTGDFREAGYRITVFQVRKDGQQEMARRAALHLETALTAMVDNHARRSFDALNRCCMILGMPAHR